MSEKLAEFLFNTKTRKVKVSFLNIKLVTTHNNQQLTSTFTTSPFPPCPLFTPVSPILLWRNAHFLSSRIAKINRITGKNYIYCRRISAREFNLLWWFSKADRVTTHTHAHFCCVLSFEFRPAVVSSLLWPGDRAVWERERVGESMCI